MHLLPIYLILCCLCYCYGQNWQTVQRKSFRPGLFRACDLPKLKNGVIRLRHRGRLASFTCRAPYVLHGDRYASCISGRWDVPVPTCIKPGCPRLPNPENAVVYPQQENAILTMFCNSGYQRVGSAQTYCDGKSWDRPLGVCREITTATQTSCDFEVDDLCGWIQDANHDFDWKRTNGVSFGKVISIGPSHDHTIQTPLQGYYMYLDMKDEEAGTKARLISPSFYANQSVNACFKLYYHMYGLSPGKLRVYAKPLSTEILDVVSNDGYKFFETVGNQGNAWKEGFFQLPVFQEDFQIVIEGTSTRSYDSHIAIDDLALMNGTDCNAGDATATTPAEEEDGIFGTLSCENRCSEEETTLTGHFSDIMTANNGTRIQKCDCFYGCEDIGTCCNNYKAICVQATTPATMEEEVANKPMNAKTTTSTTTKETTLKSTTTTSTTPVPKTTQKKTTTPRTSTTTTTTTTTTTPKTTPSTTTIKQTSTTKLVDDIVPLEVTTYEDDYSEEDVVHLPPGRHTEVVFPSAPTDTHFALYTFLTSFLILVAIIGVAGGGILYHRQKCDPRNYKHSSKGNGGELAGDEVRFLSTEEQLDFALQTPTTSDK